VTNRDEIERLAVMALAEALIADPFYAAVTIDHEADETARRGVLAEYCRYSLLEGYQIGMVTLDSFGAAVWNLPQPSDVAEQVLRAKHAAFESLLGARGFDAYRAIIDFMEPTAHSVVPEGSWYLSILGVAPQRQGQGLGRTLLEPTLHDADRSGARCFLETFNGAALRFYRRLGFDEVAEHLEPTTRARYWIMVREPHPIIR
jgi:ribosomal protein S18 acetylase RimI-like enzyme